MKILICGDSFAADWTVKYKGVGWPNLLSTEFDITNIAQAGCSEYRIYKQLTSTNLENYDLVIVSHTSPYRLYTDNHSIHDDDSLHAFSDLIYSDVKAHGIQPVIEYFENYFSIEYAEFVHNLICEKIDKLKKDNIIHITSFKWDDLYPFPNMINFQDVFNKYRGLINHYTDEGNNIVFSTLMKRIMPEWWNR